MSRRLTPWILVRPSFLVRSLAAIFLLGAVATVSLAAPEDYTRNVAIVVWNGAEVLDWAGPAEIFSSAAGFGRQGDVPAFNVYTVSKTTDAITSQGFVSVNPQYSIDAAPRPDIIVLPGGGTKSVLDDPEFLAWAAKASKEAEVALSVCTGAFVLGRAGLLDGEQVTTWYGATDRLEREFPAATVIRGKRFVDNGNVITTAGISAGMDGSLHLVARLLGRAVADETAEYMEYRWTPEPYLAKSYSILNPSLDERGRRIQQAELDVRAGSTGAAIVSYQTLLQEDPSDTQVWMSLGAAYYSSKEFELAGDAYNKASGSGPLGLRASFNGACSYALSGQSDSAFGLLERVVDSGLATRDLLTGDPDLESLRSDPRFAVLLARLP
ncbi:MAG: DJ-1/PfpI family protein [Thermoanaerobaculia bacterium]|nr:DJ-1/PfpI family protein [Thermoanaerobaculia bacterium]